MKCRETGTLTLLIGSRRSLIVALKELHYDPTDTISFYLAPGKSAAEMGWYWHLHTNVTDITASACDNETDCVERINNSTGRCCIADFLTQRIFIKSCTDRSSIRTRYLIHFVIYRTVPRKLRPVFVRINSFPQLNFQESKCEENVIRPVVPALTIGWNSGR